MAGENTLIIRINGSAKDFLDELKKVEKQTESIGKVLSKTAKASAAAFAGFAGSIALVTKQFVDYEKALVGVGKTTGIEGKKLEAFGKEFQNLSTEIPVTTNELLGIAQAAGQLGVSGEKNLLKFTETVAKLGVSTDLSGEQAATALTRILNVTNESIENIDTLGSVVVALGNNFAATESEIVRMATEVSRATAVFDVSSSQAAALGTALKSVGIQAELGGSSVGKAFRTIDKILVEGGDKLVALEKITGQTADEFKRAFEQDSVAAFQTFIEGLGRIDEEGGSVALTLEEIGLKGDEVNKTLPVLAKNSQLVGRALALANKETKEATALNREAEKAFSTLGSEFQKLLNVATNLAVDIGTELAPTIRDLVVDLREFLTAIRENEENLLSNIAAFLKWGAIVTGAVASLTSFILGVLKVSSILSALGPVLFTAGGAAAAFWAAVTGPVGIAVAGVAALTAGLIALNEAASVKQTPETLTEINSELEKLKKNREILDQPIRLGGDPNEVKKLDEQIAKLEDLRQAKIRASEDFGTGSLLIRPEADTGPNLGASAFGLEEQTLPFRPVEQEGDDSVEKTKENEQKRTEVIDAETKKRIAKLQQANAELKAIRDARARGITEEEKDILQKQAEIDNQRLAASKIANEKERRAALENINLTNAEVLAEIEEFNAQAEERKAASNERKRVLDEQFRDLTKEEQALFDEEDRARLEQNIITQEEAEIAAAEAKLERQRLEREQFLQDEIQFGTTLANLKKFFNSQEVQGAKDTGAQLAQLSRSKNATLKGIGKAAARVNAAIATSEGAIKAYTSLAGIPIVGPALGAAAAGALIAFGLEQQQQIAAANQGGIIPGGLNTPNADSQLSFLTPGELVVPRQNFDEVVEATAESRGFENTDDDTTDTLTIMLEPAGEFVGVIEQKIVERRVQKRSLI